MHADEDTHDTRTNNTDNDTITDVGQDDEYNITFDDIAGPMPSAPAKKKSGFSGFFETIEHGLFSLMRGKKKQRQEPARREPARTVPVQEPQELGVEDLDDASPAESPAANPSKQASVVKPRVFRTPSLPTASSIFAKVVKVFSRTIYLVLLCYGIFLISSELPTHPTLVVGIVLVAVGANVLSKDS
jgi:hypothetical protein